MTEYNVIGDIAGQYDALIELLGKMPKKAIPVSLGDQTDRGPKSKQVLDFFMKNGMAVLGNHCHLMLDHFTNGGYYEPGLWLYYNGGFPTIHSFDLEHADDEIDQSYLDYLKGLPLYLKLDGGDRYPDGLFLSHAPKHPILSLDQCCELGDGFWRPSGKFRNTDNTLIWNRGTPREMPGMFQAHGHNSVKYPHWYGGEEKPFAVALDTSRVKILTGMHWPSMEIFQVGFA
jgi:Calcineurin-like phosphoesterase